MVTNPTDSAELAAGEPVRAHGSVAVIDVGSTSIRMAVAEIDERGEAHTLESLTQAVNLGKDTFTRGSIEKSTIEECVRVLKSYRRILDEYQIRRSDQIRVVATSAVREAENRLAFLDRVYSATGIEIEPLDEAEVNRITYLGIMPQLESDPALTCANTVIVEVGGGSTELLLVQEGAVTYSHTFRLGSLRLRETIEAYRTPTLSVWDVIESQIERTVEEAVEHVPKEGTLEMIAMGGDVRFAASQIRPDWRREDLCRIRVADLETFTERMLAFSEDELRQKFHLAFPDAESLGPALLTYLQLARTLNLDHVLITNVSLRGGLLKEMAIRGAWTEQFSQQIIRSALDLGKKFDFDETHATHVAELSKMLFRQLRAEHQLDPRYELILYIAALLHEIGLYVSNRGYHKHSMYLIANGELFGLGRRDVLLVALVARYHRRTSPKPTHEGYTTLDREHRIAVAKMAAMLRVADALDHSYSQRIREFHCIREESRLVISIPRVKDLSLEQLGLMQKGTLFEEIFGMPVLLRTGSPQEG